MSSTLLFQSPAAASSAQPATAAAASTVVTPETGIDGGTIHAAPDPNYIQNPILSQLVGKKMHQMDAYHAIKKKRPDYSDATKRIFAWRDAMIQRRARLKNLTSEQLTDINVLIEDEDVDEDEGVDEDEEADD
jgi:hypothetical protein